jgi:heme/copper-type cytochrome/quinol oxidase subunit 2
MTTPAPAPTPAAPAASDGKTLGIVGLILAIFIPIVGLIVSIVARSQSKRAGVSNGAATAGIVISILIMVIGIIVAIVVGVSGAALFGNLAQICAEYGTGEWVINGVTYTCG